MCSEEKRGIPNSNPFLLAIPKYDRFFSPSPRDLISSLFFKIYAWSCVCLGEKSHFTSLVTQAAHEIYNVQSLCLWCIRKCKLQGTALLRVHARHIQCYNSRGVCYGGKWRESCESPGKTTPANRYRSIDLLHYCTYRRPSRTPSCQT